MPKEPEPDYFFKYTAENMMDAMHHHHVNSSFFLNFCGQKSSTSFLGARLHRRLQDGRVLVGLRGRIQARGDLHGRPREGLHAQAQEVQARPGHRGGQRHTHQRHLSVLRSLVSISRCVCQLQVIYSE